MEKKGTIIICVEKVDDEFIKNTVLGKEFNLSNEAEILIDFEAIAVIEKIDKLAGKNFA